MCTMDIYDKSQIKSALRQSFGSVIYRINELADEVFFQAFEEDKWSPADILGHLILSTKPLSKALAMPRLDLQATFGKRNRPESTVQEVHDKYYSRLGEGVKAPPAFTYRNVTSKSKEQLIQSFNDELRLLLERIDTWSEKDLSDYVLPHPALGKLTIREMLFFTHFHTLHHLNQLTLQEVS